MPTAKPITILSRPRWLELAAGFADANYRQAWAFGHATAARLGAASEHVAIHDAAHRLIGLSDVRVKAMPVLGGGIAYVSGGPLVRHKDATDPAQALDAALAALEDHYVHQRGLVLRVAPAPCPAPWKEQLLAVYRRRGYESLPEPNPTILVDLAPDLAAIRKNLDQKWRNGLNGAERNGLTIRTGAAAPLFDAFCDLFDQLIGRKGFDVALDGHFYAAVQQAADESEKFALTIIDYEGHPVAGHVGSIAGDTAVYLLGATSEEGLKLKAAYLLQWSAIQQAKAAGCRWYDLGGIDAVNNPGVYHFKSGMAGVEVTPAGPFELKRPGIKTTLTLAGEKLYRRIKDRKKKAVTSGS